MRLIGIGIVLALLCGFWSQTETSSADPAPVPITYAYVKGAHLYFSNGQKISIQHELYGVTPGLKWIIYYENSYIYVQKVSDPKQIYRVSQSFPGFVTDLQEFYLTKTSIYLLQHKDSYIAKIDLATREISNVRNLQELKFALDPITHQKNQYSFTIEAVKNDAFFIARALLNYSSVPYAFFWCKKQKCVQVNLPIKDQFYGRIVISPSQNLLAYPEYDKLTVKTTVHITNLAGKQKTEIIEPQFGFIKNLYWINENELGWIMEQGTDYDPDTSHKTLETVRYSLITGKETIKPESTLRYSTGPTTEISFNTQTGILTKKVTGQPDTIISDHVAAVYI